ncbi:hypothetical protein OS190_18610 [Sulfitobacter sp. F26204]|uniref:hypothetical protein n=1 Tax=Sulfitobacter sp. F26204 TaxID=2996014 RepID=UPI00225DFFC8|nr:hypothetical protein [Sulfitobacter sp. F26204]MCX7561579.1 hypothetical protein [Sulfitobacter sp. F26204]
MLRVLLVLFGTLAATAAFSQAELPIQIDPSTYGGKYCINNRTDCYTGSNSVNLFPGRHSIVFAPSNGFSFEVAADGAVTVPAPYDHAADGGDQTLTFLTSSVGLDFGSYEGSIEIVNATNTIPPTSGVIWLELVNGIDGWIFQLAPGTSFRFDTNETGHPAANSTQATISGRTMQLNTRTLLIDPNGYTGDFGIVNNRPPQDKVRRVQLIPGIDRYILSFASGTALLFDFASDGTIERVHSSGAEDDNNTLRLLPMDLFVQPLDLSQGWYIIGAESRPVLPGARTVKVIPDIPAWALSVGPGTAARFDVDATGIAQPPVVAVFEGVDIYEFELFERRTEVTCIFSADIDLRQDLTGSLPVDPANPELSVSAEMTFQLTPYFQGSTYTWHHWEGKIEITDTGGETLSGLSGAFLHSDDGQQRRYSFYAQELSGSLGGESPPSDKDVMLSLTGPSTGSIDLDFPSDLTDWNVLTSRVFVFRAFASRALAKVSMLNFRGTGCS